MKPSSKELVAAGLSDADIGKLIALLKAFTPHDGTFALRVPGVYALRASRPSGELAHAVQGPALCIVAQGAKTVMLGEDIFEYDLSRMLVFSADVPVSGQVTQASAAAPFLGFKMDLDPVQLADLVLKVYPHGLPRAPDTRAVYVAPTVPAIVNAATRLLELATQPEEAALLAPLVIEEILIRLLRSGVGHRIAQLGQAESGLQRVAKALAWLRNNYAQPMNVEALAGQVHMSVSSFHHHFKAVTSMSPLQFQKVLRLQEARRLMLSSMMDASTAARHAGYLSASQFSREYARQFGSAPTKDIAKLREQGVAVADAPQPAAGSISAV